MRPLKNLCEVAVIGGGLAGLSLHDTPRVSVVW